MLLCAVGFAALTLLLVIFFLVIQSWVWYGASSSGHYNSDDYTTSVEYRNHVAHIEDTRDYCLVHGMTYRTFPDRFDGYAYIGTICQRCKYTLITGIYSTTNGYMFIKCIMTILYVCACVHHAYSMYLCMMIYSEQLILLFSDRQQCGNNYKTR